MPSGSFEKASSVGARMVSLLESSIASSSPATLIAVNKVENSALFSKRVKVSTLLFHAKILVVSNKVVNVNNKFFIILSVRLFALIKTL